MAEEKKTSPIPEEEQPEAAAPGAPESPPVPEPGAQGVTPGMEGPPVPENKVIDLSSVRAGAGQEQQQTGPEAGPAKEGGQEWEKPQEQELPRRGRRPKSKEAPAQGERPKRKSILASLSDRFDYGQNPEKTLDGALIRSYECDPLTAGSEFLLSKVRYKSITGREQKRGADVLCYQIRQSFPPGELDPEEALNIGYELAMRWTKGNTLLRCHLLYKLRKHIFRLLVGVSQVVIQFSAE